MRRKRRPSTTRFSDLLFEKVSAAATFGRVALSAYFLSQQCFNGPRFAARRNMRLWTRLGTALLLLFCYPTLAQNSETLFLPIAVANDNRMPAGQLTNGVLELRLALNEATWYPEEESGGRRDVYAFAEEGHAPQSSGPLIRVPQGTQIHISIRNTLPLAAKIHGLHSHPGGAKDVVSLAPGETRQLQFAAGEPGTYIYWATTSDSSLEHRSDKETLLSGAFVVDAAGTKPNDRIFVLGLWSRGTTAETFQEILSINGKTWPYTERLTLKQSETLHWRVINPTASDHAMHLHGFFFTVDGAGDGERYEQYAVAQRYMSVTEHIDVGRTFEMTWTPDRAGNWLFHCHMASHMSPSASLPPEEAHPTAYSSEHEHSASMGGLVIGLTVLSNASTAPSSASTNAAHKVQLVISDNPEKIPLYDLQVNDSREPAAKDKKKSSSLLGPPIILMRGEIAEIEVKNMTSNPTVIHWHGMEIESYYDGVAGWTGTAQQRSPAIAPGTSFVARMMPPRAGTFIYHTHWHDEKQLLNGVYGPLIVLEPGQKYDPQHDRTFVFSMGKYAPFGFLLLINGHPEPDPINLNSGTKYRLRFINITDNAADLRVRLTSKDAPVQWIVIAKDGADLPPAQLKPSRADMGITVGETYDVEYQAETGGLADLQIWEPSFPTPATQPLEFVPAK
jgi:FtsP/CotA-like multicopper oxidase with cupredoxin domain